MLPTPPVSPAATGRSFGFIALFIKVVLLIYALFPAEGKAQVGSTIAAGTEIVIVQVGHLQSRHYSGASFVVGVDVLDDKGNVLVANGTPVATNVAPIPARGLGKGGQLWLTFNQTTTTDGQPLSLQGNFVAYGRNRVGLVTGLTVGLAFVAFPWNFFCLMIRGQEAMLPHGTTYYGVRTLNPTVVQANGGH